MCGRCLKEGNLFIPNSKKNKRVLQSSPTLTSPTTFSSYRQYSQIQILLNPSNRRYFVACSRINGSEDIVKNDPTILIYITSKRSLSESNNHTLVNDLLQRFANSASNVTVCVIDIDETGEWVKSYALMELHEKLIKLFMLVNIV